MLRKVTVKSFEEDWNVAVLWIPVNMAKTLIIVNVFHFTIFTILFLSFLLLMMIEMIEEALMDTGTGV